MRDLVLSRLPLMPRFRRRLMSVPYDQGRPIWVDDDRFDITYHVRHTALPKPGTWEQLIALTNRVQESMLDRERPLWELWFVEGLEGGNVAIIQKTHHALIDGVSGVDVATLLLDMDPESVARRSCPSGLPEPAPSPSQLLHRHVARASHGTGRDRAVGAPHASAARATRSSEMRRARRFDEHDGDA